VVAAPGGAVDLVGIAGEPDPRSVRRPDEVGALAAVAVVHGDQHEAAVVARPGDRLGNLRRVLADLVGVGVGRGAECVEVELLVEVEVGLRPLAGPRVTRVVKAAAVGVPGDAAAGGAAVDARDHVWKRTAGGDVEDTDVAALGAAL